MITTCFAHATAIRPFTSSISPSVIPLSKGKRFTAQHVNVCRHHRARNNAVVNMSSNETETNEKNEGAPQEDDDDSGVSVWGVTSFAIIFIIFAFGIAATLARDFIPGGITTPAS